MPSLSERLDDYPDLPPDERAAVDRDVAASGSPDDTRRLSEERSLAAVLDAAATARLGRPVTADHVADVLADASLGIDHPDAARVRAAIDADPELKAAADRIRARLDARPARTEAPEEQFERLFGAELPAHAELAEIAEAPARRTRPDRAAASDRAAAAPARARFASMRRALVLAAGVVVAYGALFAVSESQRTDRARVADLKDLADYAPATTRGADGSDRLSERLDAALDAVVEARQTTLGLFPHFDAPALDAAATEISAVIGESAPGTTVSQEARLALARVRLYQNRDADAVRLLGALVRERSYRAPEARRLLDFVRMQS